MHSQEFLAKGATVQSAIISEKIILQKQFRVYDYIGNHIKAKFTKTFELEESKSELIDEIVTIIEPQMVESEHFVDNLYQIHHSTEIEYSEQLTQLKVTLTNDEESKADIVAYNIDITSL